MDELQIHKDFKKCCAVIESLEFSTKELEKSRGQMKTTYNLMKAFRRKHERHESVHKLYGDLYCKYAQK